MTTSNINYDWQYNALHNTACKFAGEDVLCRHTGLYLDFRSTGLRKWRANDTLPNRKMVKLNVSHSVTGYGLIAQKTIKDLSYQSSRKVLDLQVYRHDLQRAEELGKSIIPEKVMASLAPLHAVYVSVQNKLSIMIVQLLDLSALSRLETAYTDAEDVYLLSGPTVSLQRCSNRQI